MNHVIKIKVNQTEQDSVFVIHPEKATAIGLRSSNLVCIRFGSQKHNAIIRIDHEIFPENVLLSKNLIQELHLPDYPIYEVYTNGNEVNIGPYIGILAHNEDKRLTSSRLNKMTVYVKEYVKLHGALVVFALNKVDKENRLIEGYCYNPEKKYWQRGTFPYPSSIYRTIGLSMEWKNHFRSVIGDKTFNSRFFSKWQMYQWFSKEPGISQHLPYTVLYHSPGDVHGMLERYPKVYIKPVLGLQGRGIIRISIENGTFILKYREKGVNQTVHFNDWHKVEEYISERFRHGRYLIQQAIDLLKYDGRIIDFRCVVQKDQSGLWVCRAIIGRSGAKESIVSNISSGGVAFTAENILNKIFPESEDIIDNLKRKIEVFAINVCNTLDKYVVNCGVLGLDIGMDSQKRLWLIEINNRDPDPGIALDIHDMQLFYTLKNGPLYYAKYLAGFKEEPQNDG